MGEDIVFCKELEEIVCRTALKTSCPLQEGIVFYENEIVCLYGSVSVCHSDGVMGDRYKKRGERDVWRHEKAHSR